MTAPSRRCHDDRNVRLHGRLSDNDTNQLYIFSKRRKIEESPEMGRDTVVLQKDWTRRIQTAQKTLGLKSKLTL